MNNQFILDLLKNGGWLLLVTALLFTNLQSLNNGQKDNSGRIELLQQQFSSMEKDSEMVLYRLEELSKKIEKMSTKPKE